ncbi:helix-turn-helix domain-containing protein [Pedobacter montanisoli]|uniref:Helix-turn-helix domain-containing protein n=1 Tax=Pedobacter montanisoli TaxID=2923277 RepID=A0ABS9ZZ89_9SPHI|nr:helix-turn-helix domain-containing protein [Pedobacter montanisoli]MCJ0743636.1 helix-turn-helix domain-containing protein [Pedobacter montanisoli]
MKKRKGYYLLSHEEFTLLQTAVTQYMETSAYIRKKLLQKELLTTKQVAEKYCVSRQTLYRFRKAGILLAIVKHGSYYFDADETREFFLRYRGISTSSM